MSNENALEQKRHELAASPLFNLTFMPSMLLLPDSLRIYRATDAATRILGYSHDELQERTLYDLLVEPREQVDAALQRARTQPPFVLTVRRPNHEERIIEGTVHSLDEYALLHFSFADLTDLHLPRRALRETSAISPRHTGYAYLRELVCAISRTFGGAHAYIGRLVEAQRVRGIAYAIGGALHEPMDYHLQGTPCENVVAAGFCAYPSGVQELFPNDAALRAMVSRAT
jgi:PAS domain-containing protein